MKKIIAIPRINALGLKGPEKFPGLLLKKIPFSIIKIHNQDISKDEKEIYKTINTELKQNNKLTLIGGDHSITYPSAKAFLKNYKQKSFIIIFDAHADCMPPMKEPTHEEFLAGLIKIKWPTKNIIIIGLRKVEPEEQKLLEKHNIKYFSKYNKNILNQINKLTKNKKIYLSIDIDAIDPRYAPAVNYQEKKGLTKKQFFKIVKSIHKKQQPIITDIVEIVPHKDIKNKTLKISKKIIRIITK